MATEWTKTERVGFEEKMTTSNGKAIKVLVEKDFACLGKGAEENEGILSKPKLNCYL